MSTNQLKVVASFVLFSFTFPIVLYVLMRFHYFIVDGNFRTPPNELPRKLADSVCLALPVISLLMFVQMGFADFQRWWLDSPFVVSGLALLFFGVAPAILGRAIVRVWRR
jgi:hypothetical protein